MDDKQLQKILETMLGLIDDLTFAAQYSGGNDRSEPFVEIRMAAEELKPKIKAACDG